MNYSGDALPLTPSTSAYIAFQGGIPSPIYFQLATEAMGLSPEWLRLGG